MADQTRSLDRLTYIDWMRGLACLLMFQTHCYDSWLRPEDRQSALFGWSRLLGTLPAPIFIFLAGVSFALVTDRLRQKGIDRDSIARQTMLRGAEIFGLGLLFRAQEFLLGYPWSPWTDLLRVDVLNILGISMVLMGALCWLTSSPTATVKSENRGKVERSRQRSSGTSTAFTCMACRSLGSSRCFHGLHLQSRDWLSALVCSRRELNKGKHGPF